MAKSYETLNGFKKISAKNKKSIWLLLLVIFLQTTLLVVYMNYKVGFHIDELWSYSLSNSLDEVYIFYQKSNPDLYDKWLDGRFFNDYLTVQPNERFCFSKVRENQVRDVHPPLYYFVFHAVCSLFPDSFSKWYGNSVNIVFFVFSQLLLFKITKKLFSEKIAFFGVVFYGFSAAAIDTFILIRMYAPLVFLFLLTYYLYYRVLHRSGSLLSAIPIFLILSMGSLTHYFYVVYAFFLTLTFGILCLCKKKIRLFWIVSIASLLGVFAAYVIFPEMLLHITSTSRGVEATSNLSFISIIWQREFWRFISSYCFGLPDMSANAFGVFLNVIFVLFIATFTFSPVLISILGDDFTAKDWYVGHGAFKYVVDLLRKMKDLAYESFEYNCDRLIFFLPIYFFVVAIVRMINYDVMSNFGSRYFFPVFPYVFVGIVLIASKIIKSMKINGFKHIKFFEYFFLTLFCISGLFFNLNFSFKDKEGIFYPETSRTSFKKTFEDAVCIMLAKNPMDIHDLSINLRCCKKVYNIKKLQTENIPIGELEAGDKNIFVSPYSIDSKAVVKMFYSKYGIKLKKILFGSNFLIYYDVYEIELNS